MTKLANLPLLPLEIWEKRLAQGQLDALLRRLAVLPDSEPVEPARLRLQQLLTTYRQEFDPSGQRPVAIFSAPGRTELLGNHTDHQAGKILAAAVNRDILAVAGFNGSDLPPRIRLASAGWPLNESVLENLHPLSWETGSSRSLVRGIAAGIAKMAWEGNLQGLPQAGNLQAAWEARKQEDSYLYLSDVVDPELICPDLIYPDLQLRGLDIATESQVKTGSGISSSAAFEVCLAKVMASLWGYSALGPLELAQIGQYAENLYFGKPSGLMDQLASAVGGAVYVDFAGPRPLVLKHSLPLAQAGYQLVLVDSKSDHSNLSAEYASITEEMGQVAQACGQELLSQVPAADFWAALPRLHQQLPDRALLRALHYYGECQRVEEAREALESKDIASYLTLVKASGRSSYMYLQNIYPTGAVQDQAMGLALALAEHSLAGQGAFRVHGGGFGGTIQAIVPQDLYPRFKQDLEGVFGPDSCHDLKIRPEGAVCLDPDDCKLA